jgi:hypothetical protein
LADAADELGRPGVLEGVEDLVPVGQAVVDEDCGAVAEDGGCGSPCVGGF